MSQRDPFVHKAEKESLLLDNFASGDILYGTSEATEKIGTQLREKGHLSLGIDLYNEYAILRWAEFNREDFTSKKHLSLAFGLHRFAERFEGHNHYDSEYYTTSNNEYYDPFTKKRCKLGILWTIGRNHSVHFIFDNHFNFESCFKKFKTYTCSELRFIYRNWEYLGPINLIKFYEEKAGKFIEIPAPWVHNPALVSGYSPKNRHKYASFFAEFKSEMSSSLRKAGLSVLNPAIAKFIKVNPLADLDSIIAVFKQLEEAKLGDNYHISETFLFKYLEEKAARTTIITALSLLNIANIALPKELIRWISEDPATANSRAVSYGSAIKHLQEEKVTMNYMLEKSLLENRDRVLERAKEMVCYRNEIKDSVDPLRMEGITIEDLIIEWEKLDKYIKKHADDMKEHSAALALKNTFKKVDGSLLQIARLHPIYQEDIDLNSIYSFFFKLFTRKKESIIDVFDEIHIAFCITVEKGENAASFKKRIMSLLEIKSNVCTFKKYVVTESYYLRIQNPDGDQAKITFLKPNLDEDLSKIMVTTVTKNKTLNLSTCWGTPLEDNECIPLGNPVRITVSDKILDKDDKEATVPPLASAPTPEPLLHHPPQRVR